MIALWQIFRLFKLVRHFKATEVLVITTKKAFSQIVGILTLLVFLVILFAIILYELESGHACFVGDPDCEVPGSIAGVVVEGQRIIVNKLGSTSQIPDVFYGMWFSFVTLTTTG